MPARMTKRTELGPSRALPTARDVHSSAASEDLATGALGPLVHAIRIGVLVARFLLKRSHVAQRAAGL
jgi:hypothetical protein